MTAISWRVVELLSRLLEPDDRDAALGDFAESNLPVGTVLCDLLGLIMRRQAAWWNRWQPWLALFGIVGPVTLMLFLFLLSLTRTYDLYLWIVGNYQHFDPAMLDQTGLTVPRGVAIMVRHSLLLLGWSWTAGFALASLSRRVILVNGMLVCGIIAALLLVALNTAPPPKPLLLLSLVALLLATPLLGGTIQGLRKERLSPRPALLLAVAIALLTALSIWNAGWWRGGPWNNLQLALSLLLCWPAAYIATSAVREARRSSNPEAA